MGTWRKRIVTSAFRQLTSCSLWFLLTVLVTICLAINIAQKCLLDRYESDAWIIWAPIGIFAAGLLSILIWMGFNAAAVVKKWRKASWPLIFACAGVVLGILLPYALGQFFYMSKVALPAWRQKTWSLTLDVPESLPAPAVRFMFSSANDTDPQLNLTLSCTRKDVGNVPCRSLIEPKTKRGWQAWSVYTEDPEFAMDLNYPLIITAKVRAKKPQYFADAESIFSPLWMNLWDANIMRTSNIQIGCGRNKYLRVPWESSLKAKVAFSQSNFRDTWPGPDQGGRTCTGKTLSSYTVYKSTLEPEYLQSNLTECAKGKCDLRIQILAEDLTTETYESARGTDKVKILVDEAGVLGGVAFFVWFLGIYIIGGPTEDPLETDQAE